jgi:uncharacterized protein involved in exopolysaccharide biosynthesis
MAVQIDPPGQIQEFLDILKRRRWQILLPTLFLFSLGIASAVIVPKKYLVTTQVELRELFLGDDARGAGRDGTQAVAENAPQQIKSMRRITEVLDTLKWPDYLTLGRVGQNEYRQGVQGNVSVIVPRKDRDVGSSFVTIEYRNVDKDRAQTFLKALRQAWIEQVVQREQSRHDIEYNKLLERAADLDKEYLKLTRQLTDLRTGNDISPTQPTPGVNQQRVEDPKIVRFERNVERSEEANLELATAAASLEIAREQLAETDPEIPKKKVVAGVTYDADIQKLRNDQLKKELELDGIRPEHPRYKKTQRELAGLEDRIAELERSQTEAEEQVGFEPNPLYLSLERAVGALELEVGRLSAEREALRKALEVGRDEIRRLNEAYREDRAYNARLATIQLAMGEIEIARQMKKQRRDVVFGPAGNPFQITQEVEPPGSPTEPDPLLILAFSLVLGLGAGFGGALLAEFSKSCFRNTADISRVLVVPVLGAISPIITRVQRRRRLLLRFLVGSMSLLLIGSVLFVTWAWSSEPTILGDRMNDSIERLRGLFL